MNAGSQLPEGFETLEPFVADWSIARSQDRLQARLNSEPDDREQFFLAARDLVPAALELLDRKTSAEYDARETNLMNLMLTLAHISIAVEIQGPDEPFHASYARFITITRSAADRPAG